MTNKEMFIKAHEIARRIVDVVGNYSIAFKFALKQVWAVAKASEKKINYNQMNVMSNCSMFSEERRDCGIPASITCDEIDDAESLFGLMVNLPHANIFMRFGIAFSASRPLIG